MSAVASRPRTALLLLATGQPELSAAGPLAKLAGQPVIRHAALGLAPWVDLVQPVGEAAAIATALAGLAHLPVVAGGATRQQSVHAGLEALAAHAPQWVLVHDAARPYVPPATVAALLSALERGVPGAIPALPVTETLKRATADQLIAASVAHVNLYRAQTPQAFHFPTLLHLHRSAGADFPDDAALLEAASLPVALVCGSEDNIKLTSEDDMRRSERVLRGTMLPRVGFGFDVHALSEGRRLVLCGIEIPHTHGLLGHSDADVAMHALCDAIYGALAEGDIGRHFPPSEASWKDADSSLFLRHAAGRIAARGGLLANADITLVCERPKIGPFAPRMAARLAEILGAEPGQISVKATTTERLGFTGRMEGIAAQAVATVLLPW